MPKASIVIPCYNASEYVETALASAQGQTVDDTEIICVDDGSTDDTLPILRRLATADSRISVITQPNGGEGAARDAGLDAAVGDWLYFLDADDIMEPTLLEESIACGEREGADIVIFRTTLLDNQTGERRPCPWAFKRDWVAEDAFDPHEHPAHVFDSFQNWVHNKLFRGAFVRGHDLHMQHVHRTADLLFTCRALAEASRIALLDRPLHLYRVNNAQSAMLTSDRYPLDFYKGFLALRNSLVDQGTWELYHDSFVNWALAGVAVNLQLARDYEAYRTIAETLIHEGLRELDLASLSHDSAYMPRYYDQLQPLIEAPWRDDAWQETLFRMALSFHLERDGALTAASAERIQRNLLDERLADADARIQDANESLRCESEASAMKDELIARQMQTIADLGQQLTETQHAFDCVVDSRSFAIGRAATALPRKLRDGARGNYHG